MGNPPRYGWRWYRVEHDCLVSPLVGRVPLPRNGILNGAYFIPRADHMWSVVSMIAAQRWYPYAVTFGRVDGPFADDPTMPRVGSLKATRYTALAIFSPYATEAMAAAYTIPCTSILTEAALRAHEQYWSPTEPTPSVRPLRITFVCTGNTCRSPMAEIMFAHQLRQCGLDKLVHVASAGTAAWRNSGLDPRAARVLRAHGYPDHHDVSALTNEHLHSDLLVGAARKHLHRLLDFRVASERLGLLRAFDSAWAGRPDAPDLADPFCSGDFDATFADIAAALPGLHRWVDQRLTCATPAHTPTAALATATTHP